MTRKHGNTLSLQRIIEMHEWVNSFISVFGVGWLFYERFSHNRSEKLDKIDNLCSSINDASSKYWGCSDIGDERSHLCNKIKVDLQRTLILSKTIDDNLFSRVSKWWETITSGDFENIRSLEPDRVKKISSEYIDIYNCLSSIRK